MGPAEDGWREHWPGTACRKGHLGRSGAAPRQGKTRALGTAARGRQARAPRQGPEGCTPGPGTPRAQAHHRREQAGGAGGGGTGPFAAGAPGRAGHRESWSEPHTQGHAVGSAQLVRGHAESKPGCVATVDTHPGQHLRERRGHVRDTDGQVLTTAITGMSTPRFPALLEAWRDRAGSLTSTISFIKQKDRKTPNSTARNETPSSKQNSERHVQGNRYRCLTLQSKKGHSQRHTGDGTCKPWQLCTNTLHRYRREA